MAGWPDGVRRGRQQGGVSGARRGKLGRASCRRHLGEANACDGEVGDGQLRAGDGKVRRQGSG
jgi:hypothetical protein